MEHKFNDHKRAKIKIGDNIDPLLIEYKDRIDYIKNNCKDLINKAEKIDIACKIDDIFILRFLLSARSFDIAIENFEKTINYKIENHELLKDIHKNGTKAIPNIHIFERFMITGYVGSLKPENHPIFIVRPGVSAVKSLLKALTVDQAANILLLFNEIGFQKCDEQTRKSRKLVKLIFVVDLMDFSIFKLNKNFAKAAGKSSKLSEIYYPQLSGLKIPINLPSTFKLIFKFMSTIHSQQEIDKGK